MPREPLVHNRSNPITEGIWREGDAVHKVIRGDAAAPHPDWDASDDPRDWRFWEREALAYADGIPQVWAEHGLRGPRLLALEEREDGARELRLEAVEGRTGRALGLSDHVELARRLGRAQGAVGWVERPWTSRNFLREHCASKHVDPGFLDDDRAWDHPLIRETWPVSLRPALRRLHHAREELFEVVEAAPRALCHLDLWAHNAVFADEEVVLLDWAVVGEGALGEDPANLVAEAVLDQLLLPEALPELAHGVLEAYLTGLGEVGWTGDRDAVRRAFAAASVKFHWLGPLHLERALSGGHHGYGGSELEDPRAQYRARGVVLQWLADQAASVLDG